MLVTSNANYTIIYRINLTYNSKETNYMYVYNDKAITTF